MRRMILVVIMVLMANALFAQNDFSTWTKITKDAQATIPWFFRSTTTTTIQVRQNFDWPGAYGAFYGRNLMRGKTTLTPELGIIAGPGYRSISPELLVSRSWNTMSVFSLNQASVSVSGGPHFAYHWMALTHDTSKHMKLGFDEQVYWENTSGFKPDVDLGPTVRFVGGPMYVKVWWSINPTAGPQKTQIGVGTIF